MYDVTVLTPTGIVPQRPFTDPTHIRGDVNSLQYMVDQLCLFLEHSHHKSGEPPIVVHRPGPEKYIYRLVVIQPEQLMEPKQITCVGFLGQRRPDADVALAHEFDKILVSELQDHPGLYSYSTMNLITGNYSNLVLFADEEAKNHWSRSKAHAQAVSKLAPNFYLTVRLYNGLLPRGIVDSNALTLTRIKYFDYQGTPWWQAVREMVPNGSTRG
jgi:hypothetical protein